MLRLRFIRLSQGLSQEKVSQRSGINEDVISRIETGRVNPTERELKKLARAFGISNPASLMGQVTDTESASVTQ